MADGNSAFLPEAAERAGGGSGVPDHARRSQAAGRRPARRSAWHEPVRQIQTAIEQVEVEKRKARDRWGLSAKEYIRYASSILPKWAQRTKSLDVLLPSFYPRWIAAGDFQAMLTALLSIDVPNLPSAVIARLKGEWEDEYKLEQTHDPSARRYVYVWIDGVCLDAGMELQAEYILALIGVTPECKSELLRFWKALDEAFPSTCHQPRWVHKTLNGVDKRPKFAQPNADDDLRIMWLTSNHVAAEVAMPIFAEQYTPKYDKAVDCPLKHREALLTFLDFPAKHWTYFAHLEPERKRLYDRAASNNAHHGRTLAGHGAAHGFQIGHDGVETRATTVRTKSVAEDRQRCNTPLRSRSRVRQEIRRLIQAVTQNLAAVGTAKFVRNYPISGDVGGAGALASAYGRQLSPMRDVIIRVCVAISLTPSTDRAKKVRFFSTRATICLLP